MYNSENLSILDFAMFQGKLASLLGLLAGILYSFGGLLHDIFVSGGVNTGTALAFLALVGMPFIAATAGFILGTVEAILYNAFKYLT
jgi:hypothetical protein